MTSILTVNAQARGGTILPMLLAAAYITQHSPQDNIAIKYIDEKVTATQNQTLTLVTHDGDAIVGKSVMAYLAHRMAISGARNSKEVEEWVTRSAQPALSDFRPVDGPIKELESHLTLRSYIVGHSLTLADIVVWGALRGNNVTVKLRQNLRNVNRWFNFMSVSNPWMAVIVQDFNNIGSQKKAVASAGGANYNIGLKGTENGIVTRFPPEPSGYLHISHAKAALLNDYFAHQYLGPDSRGILICRFDDTNPSKESQEFQDSILEDLQLLGIQPDRISYSSDYFQQMYDGCVKLIRLGKAYADNTPKDIMSDERRNGVPSVNRNMSADDSLARLEMMRAGNGVECYLSLQSPTPSPDRERLEDLSNYDFCAPFLDSLEGVTHALRTNEYRDRNPQYRWIQEALQIRPVEIWDFSRLSFVRTVLSKRKLTVLVNNNVVWGWDDPRMPTVRGIRRRGMTVPALREFILKQGPSQNIVNLDWSLFWATNNKIIDPVAPRYTAIPRENAVTAIINGMDGISVVGKPKHNKNAVLGMKNVVYSKEILLGHDDAASFTDNEEITLMNWGNAIVTKVTTDPSGSVSGIELHLHLEGDFKKSDKKVTWLAKEPTNMVPVEMVEFDYLITKDKLEKDDDLCSFLTPKTEFRTNAWADCNITSLSKDDIVQFDRIGFFRVDSTYQDGKPAVFFSIPTGKKVPR